MGTKKKIDEIKEEMPQWTTKEESAPEVVQTAEIVEAQPEPKVEEVKPAPKTEIMLAIDESGNYQFENQKTLGRVADMCIVEMIAPPHLIKEGRAAVSAALQMCKQFRLPQKAMGQMGFVKGRLTAYGSLYTALAQRHPDWRKQRIFYVTEAGEKICFENKNLKEEVYACVMRIYDKEGDDYNEYYFTKDDAEDAGLISNKEGSAWKNYFKDMLYHKTKARAYSREYASALEGVVMHEDVAEAYEMKDVSPRVEAKKQAAEKANALEQSLKEVQ